MCAVWWCHQGWRILGRGSFLYSSGHGPSHTCSPPLTELSASFGSNTAWEADRPFQMSDRGIRVNSIKRCAGFRDNQDEEFSLTAADCFSEVASEPRCDLKPDWSSSRKSCSQIGAPPKPTTGASEAFWSLAFTMIVLIWRGFFSSIVKSWLETVGKTHLKPADGAKIFECEGTLLLSWNLF